jgi:hypothetical protein
MPRERRPHNKFRRFLRHNRELVFVVFITLLVLAIVFGLFYFMTSSRYAIKGTLG